MIKCSNCGAENPVSHHFCQNCGDSLADFLPKSAQSNKIDGLGATQSIDSNPASEIGLEEVNSEEVNLEEVGLETESALHTTADLQKTDLTEPCLEAIETKQVELSGDLASELPTDLQEEEISLLTSSYAKALDDLEEDHLEESEEISNQIPDDIPADLIEQADLTANTEAFPKAIAEAIENVEKDLSKSLTEAELNDLQKIDFESSPDQEENETTKLLQPKPKDKPPVQLRYLRYAGLTDVGQERNHNEDNFVMLSQIFSSENAAHEVIQDQKGLFVVCDGMGGHEGGEVASAIAIKEIVQKSESFWQNRLPTEPELKQIIFSANQAIFDQNEQESRRDLGRMGTTLVMVAIHNTDVAIAHVGDSRIYRVTAQKLEQITRDHEVANRLIDQGMSVAAARARVDAHQLTQALGPFDNRQIAPTINYFQITEPTLFLLCSDGLCDDNLVEENWQTHLLPLLQPDLNLRSGVQDLIYLANYLNGHDNITAIAVQCLTELP